MHIVEELKRHTEYKGYKDNSSQVKMFWNILEEFNQAERMKFLKYATGNTKLPLNGVKGLLEAKKFIISRVAHD